MGDIIQERDDGLYTSTGNLIRTMKIQNDTNNRFQQFPSGKMEFGSGSATPDVAFERIGTGVLAVSSGTFQANVPIINITAATLAATAATHGGALVTLNRAAGITVTLPAASGSGARLRFFIGTTASGGSYIIQVANSSDTMAGTAMVLADSGDTMVGFETAASSDTITLNGTTTGGIKGDFVEAIDVATNLWYVAVRASATGTEATPFSAAV